MKKQKVKWQGVSLPVPFINDIKKHIAGKNEYRNVPAFVINAVREKMEAAGTADISNIDNFLDLLDKLELSAKKIAREDKEFVKILSFFPNIRDDLDKLGYKIRLVELPDDASKILDEICKKENMTPSEFMKKLLRECMKSDKMLNKKKKEDARNNGSRF